MTTRVLLPWYILAFAGVLLAQTQTATLRGLVQDATGSGVPDSKINITNVSTGVTRQTASGHDGRYAVPFLLPGTYSVTVEKQGFRRYMQSNVKLDVGQVMALNVSLEVGDVATSVEVSAVAPPLSTADSTVQTSISNKSITDLPLNGRLVLNLAATVPGVYTGVSSASGQNDNYTPQVGGGRIMTSEAMVDGAPLSVADPTGGARVMGGLPPSPDAVMEFAVQINGFPAEYGRTGGGVINIATKAGTNALHGTAREFMRNSALDANNFFANKNGVKLQSFKRNQYGFSLGGPVYLPHVYDGKNRTFFFVDLERTNERSPASATTTLPIDAWKSGDFSQLLNYRGAPVTLYDPLTTRSDGNGGWTRDAFPGNRIPVNRMNPVALKIIPYWPSPNRPSANSYTPLNNWFNSGTSSVDTSNLTVRADHTWTQSWRSYWRMNRSRYHIAPVQLVGGGPSDYASDNVRPRWNGVWDNTIILNPSTTVNLRLNATRWEYDLFPTTMGFDSDTLGLPSYLRSQSSAEWPHFPSIAVGGVASRGGGGGLTWLSNSGNAAGSLTKVTGKHTIKTGMEYRKFFLNFFQPSNPNGAFNFSDGWTRRDPYTYRDTEGFGFASFLLGIPSGARIG
ncbi:MAG: carboxypeptidase-like regulatory domain-containing protein, partial [Acidobacteria bacterium]|nr:carboxypeptidase-like regulatory domain-containing protein [Acidobacteriota bacterium]